MKNFIAVCLLLVVALPTFGLEDSQVMYMGGTAQGVIAGALGRLDTTSDTALIFEHSGNKVMIPYADIESYQHSSEVTRHLGVLPAIGVGLVRKRQHRHFLRISYRDSNGVAQAVVFEVPKQMPQTLQAVLQARSPGAQMICEPCGGPHSQPTTPRGGRPATEVSPAPAS